MDAPPLDGSLLYASGWYGITIPESHKSQELMISVSVMRRVEFSIKRVTMSVLVAPYKELVSP